MVGITQFRQLRIIGFPLTGESLDLIIPERFRQAHWSAFHRAIADGHTKYKGRAMRTRSVHGNGS